LGVLTETIDDKGELDTYVWEQFERKYVPSWIVKAIMAIEEKVGNPKCFIYLDFPTY